MWQFKERIVGLDIDEDCIIVVELFKAGNRIYLEKTISMEHISQLKSHSFIKESDIYINLPTQMLLFRSFQVAPSFLKSKNRYKDIITFIQRQNLPFKLEECWWSTFNIDNTLNLIAGKKEVIQKYINQVESLGMKCVGVIPGFIAIYNVLIYNYPQRKNDRFIVLNIRNSASDLVIFESKRLWSYPLGLGKKDLKDNIEESFVRFSSEVLRLLNAHYLQNPSTQNKGNIYIAGKERSSLLVSSLKNNLADFEIDFLDPFRGINCQVSLEAKEKFSLGVGLGLTGLGVNGCLDVNLIKEKIEGQRSQVRLGVFKKLISIFLIFVFFLALLLDIWLINNLRKQESIYKDTQIQISSVLPKVKELTIEKAKLEKLKDLLTKRLTGQLLNAKAMALVSNSKPSSIIIKELEATTRDSWLEVFISGIAPNYEEINNFLSNLKQIKMIKNPKVVASTFPGSEVEPNIVDFKLRFEIE